MCKKLSLQVSETSLISSIFIYYIHATTVRHTSPLCRVKGCSQYHGPLLVTGYFRAPNIWGVPKGDPNFGNYPLFFYYLSVKNANSISTIRTPPLVARDPYYGNLSPED